MFMQSTSGPSSFESTLSTVLQEVAVRDMQINKMNSSCCLGFSLVVLTLVVAAGLHCLVEADASPEKMLSDVKERELSGDTVVSYEEKSWESEQNACSYFYNERYPHYEGQLVNCTWYTAKACCKRTEVTSVFASMYLIYDASVLCRNYINYLMCFFCSPDQYKFYRNNKAMVCLDFCESLYEECKIAGFQKSLIGEKYANGTSFCKAQDFDVTDHPDCFKFDPTVFGGAGRQMSSWFILMVCLMLLLGCYY